MGNMFLAASSSGSGFNSSSFLILILIVVVGLYLMMIRPQQRRRQQAQQRLNSVQPGVRVRTTAGMYATVVDVDGDDVVLEVAPGIEVRYMKRAIMDVVSPAEESVEDMTDPAGDAEDEPAEPSPDDEDDWTRVDDENVAESGSSKKD